MLDRSIGVIVHVDELGVIEHDARLERILEERVHARADAAEPRRKPLAMGHANGVPEEIGAEDTALPHREEGAARRGFVLRLACQSRQQAKLERQAPGTSGARLDRLGLCEPFTQVDTRPRQAGGRVERGHHAVCKVACELEYALGVPLGVDFSVQAEELGLQLGRGGQALEELVRAYQGAQRSDRHLKHLDLDVLVEADGGGHALHCVGVRFWIEVGEGRQDVDERQGAVGGNVHDPDIVLVRREARHWRA